MFRLFLTGRQLIPSSAIANGGISDEEGPEFEEGKKMRAETVGKTYLWLSEQTKDLWVVSLSLLSKTGKLMALKHELDLRPAAEKF